MMLLTSVKPVKMDTMEQTVAQNVRFHIVDVDVLYNVTVLPTNVIITVAVNNCQP